MLTFHTPVPRPSDDDAAFPDVTGSPEATESPTSTQGREWWRHAVIYQIYPRSFATTAGPLGNLPGITSRMPHLARLGVETG